MRSEFATQTHRLPALRSYLGRQRIPNQADKWHRAVLHLAAAGHVLRDDQGGCIRPRQEFGCRDALKLSAECEGEDSFTGGALDRLPHIRRKEKTFLVAPTRVNLSDHFLTDPFNSVAK